MEQPTPATTDSKPTSQPYHDERRNESLFRAMRGSVRTEFFPPPYFLPLFNFQSHSLPVLYPRLSMYIYHLHLHSLPPHILYSHTLSFQIITLYGWGRQIKSNHSHFIYIDKAFMPGFRGWRLEFWFYLFGGFRMIPFPISGFEFLCFYLVRVLINGAGYGLKPSEERTRSREIQRGGEWKRGMVWCDVM